ncbi:photosynthetic NDH subunit of subcomplex B 4, chloroplastic [Amaranthus tricolor]|uniref:photosynthetic NDH subunit of subcomplex B 4, chloroplastic n=1 Tax=Amaranthus tricolor TaxID=29722 RepID=UPI00258B80E2|nr:photosynthetic NDH subunit of subcomplex B 4, chloroplastic [Amaranthus tricolor]
MVETIMNFTFSKPISLHRPSLYPLPIHSNIINIYSTNLLFKPCSISKFDSGLCHQVKKHGRGNVGKVNALPDWPLMAVLVEHIEGQRDLVTNKSIWHLSDEAIKNVYTFYIMFTCWGCCFFGATKDPYYDSEQYRGDGGDGTGHWVYEKQEDIEESARAELWREELIEEIEQKVGGLRELEDAARKEELVK